jgi:hypothetical protein
MFNVWMTCPACPSRRRTFDVGQAGPSSGYLRLRTTSTSTSTSTLDSGPRPHTSAPSIYIWSVRWIGLRVLAITCPVEAGALELNPSLL